LMKMVRPNPPLGGCSTRSNRLGTARQVRTQVKLAWGNYSEHSATSLNDGRGRS